MFEYVISGPSHTKIVYPLFQQAPLIAMTQDVLSSMPTKQHKFALLYNAMSEKKYAKDFMNYVDNVNSIHSDSGGLQIAQKGLTLTTDIEQKVYESQLNSHIAMSMDFIPITITGVGDARTDMSIKKFIGNEVKECGKQAGKCLLRQLQYFYVNKKKNKFNTKPLLILHGNDKQDYDNYFYALIKEIPNELHHLIGGYAIAGSGIGIGTMEAYDSIYMFTQLEKPDAVGKRLHFLGYGSISRLYPVMTTYLSGATSQYEVSYDSTTHTSLYNRGAMLLPGNIKKQFGTVPHNPLAQEMFGGLYDKFAKYINKHLNVDREEFVKHVTYDLEGSEKFHTNDKAALCNLAVVCLSAMYSVINFVDYIEEVYADLPHKDKIDTVVKNTFYCMTKKSNYDEWIDYKPELREALKTNKIERVEEAKDIFSFEKFTD